MLRRHRLTLLLVCATLFACKTTDTSHTSDAGHAISLSQKLEHIWAKYPVARTKLFDSIIKSNQPLSRNEWESLLAPAPEDILSSADLAQLNSQQEKQILAAKESYRQKSVIDLTKLRGQRAASARFCDAIPKGGMLHIHPTGAFDLTIIGKILETANPWIDPTQLTSSLYNPDAAARASFYPGELDFLKQISQPTYYNELAPATQQKIIALFTLPPGSHPFSRFEAVFNLQHDIFAKMKNPIDYGVTGIKLLVPKLATEGFSYLEFMDGFYPTQEVFDDYASFDRALEQNTGVKIRSKISFARTIDPASNGKLAQQYLTLTPNEYVVGIDFLANEVGAPMLERGQQLMAWFYTARQQKTRNYHISIHAGEMGDPRDVRDAIIMGAERVGHGVLLNKDPVTLAYAAATHYPIDVNLWSNVRLKVVDSVKNHPFLRFFRLGIKVSLSTDDEGIFDSNWSNECQLAINETDISYAELKEMINNSIDGAFVDETTKNRLREELTKKLVEFEKGWH